MESNYVVVDSPQTLEKLKDICKIYKVEFYDLDSYPSLTQFGRRLRGGFWLSRGYMGKAITIPQFVEHLESLSILTGKCAIQVNNEREFKLLMDHYESKGWESMEGRPATTVGYVKSCWRYENHFGWARADSRIEKGIKVISFADFAKEVGITPPVFVMTSEDGVPLYVEDKFWAAENVCGTWILDNHNDDDGTDKNEFIFDENFNEALVICASENNKSFSTKEAAVDWIVEQNKPKELVLWKAAYKFTITPGNVNLEHGDSDTDLTKEIVEKIWEAYQK